MGLCFSTDDNEGGNNSTANMSVLLKDNLDSVRMVIDHNLRSDEVNRYQPYGERIYEDRDGNTARVSFLTRNFPCSLRSAWIALF